MGSGFENIVRNSGIGSEPPLIRKKTGATIGRDPVQCVPTTIDPADILPHVRERVPTRLRDHDPTHDHRTAGQQRHQPSPSMAEIIIPVSLLRHLYPTPDQAA